MTKYTQRFLSEVKNSPFIYREFDRKSKELKLAGFDRYSALALVREISLENSLPILNAHAAEYARLFLAKNPRYTGFFKLKESKVDS